MGMQVFRKVRKNIFEHIAPAFAYLVALQFPIPHDCFKKPAADSQHLYHLFGHEKADRRQRFTCEFDGNRLIPIIELCMSAGKFSIEDRLPPVYAPLKSRSALDALFETPAFEYSPKTSKAFCAAMREAMSFQARRSKFLKSFLRMKKKQP